MLKSRYVVVKGIVYVPYKTYSHFSTRNMFIDRSTTVKMSGEAAYDLDMVEYRCKPELAAEFAEFRAALEAITVKVNYVWNLSWAKKVYGWVGGVK